MKKILVFILLSLIIGIGIVNAQVRTTYYNWGTIEMRVKIEVNNNFIKDTSTITTITCLSDKISFNSNTSNYTLILHPNKEYHITFSRPNYTNKTIYINTIGVNLNNKYIINPIINLEQNKDKDSIYSGKITYDKHKDNFVSNHSHKNLNYETVNNYAFPIDYNSGMQENNNITK